MDQQENKSAQKDPKSTLRNNFEPRARYYTVAVSEDDTQLMHGEPASEIRTELLARKGRRKGYKAVILGESETEMLVGKKERLEKIHTFKVREVDFTAEEKARREKRRHILRRLGRIAAAVALVALGFVLGLMVPRKESVPQPVPVSTDAPTAVPTAEPTAEPTAVPTAEATAVPDRFQARYQEGMDLMEAGAYRQAADVFAETEAYADSGEMLMQCSAHLAVEALKQSDRQGIIDALMLSLEEIKQKLAHSVPFRIEAGTMSLYCSTTGFYYYDGTIYDVRFQDLGKGAYKGAYVLSICFNEENELAYAGYYSIEDHGYIPLHEGFVWEEIANQLGIDP